MMWEGIRDLRPRKKIIKDGVENFYRLGLRIVTEGCHGIVPVMNLDDRQEEGKKKVLRIEERGEEVKVEGRRRGMMSLTMGMGMKMISLTSSLLMKSSNLVYIARREVKLTSYHKFIIIGCQEEYG
jgi:hypothetical protein